MSDKFCQVTPSLVGMFGLPVPSSQSSEESQSISNAPTPRLNIELSGAAISVTNNFAHVMIQSCWLNALSKCETTLVIGKRIKVLNSPFWVPDSLTAEDPETESAPPSP